jgi:hypothetical protein
MVASCFVEIAQIMKQSMHSTIYLSMPLMWLVWFLYVSQRTRSAHKHEPAAQTGPLGANCVV